jgi:signal transduction histidine kinase
VRIQYRLRKPWRELVYTALLMAVASAGSVASYLALIDTPRPSTYVVIGLIAFPIYSWVITLGASLLAALRATNDELVKIEAELRWAIARVNLLSWHSRGVVARLLHGPIQNAMHISVAKMQSPSNPVMVTDVIRELTERVQTASMASDKDSTSANEVAEVLDQALTVWSEIAEVSLDFDDAVLAALAQDPAAASIVLDLCNEQLSNAIRHGKASVASIKISLGPKLVRLRVEQNGAAEASVAPLKVGLGTEFLQSCSVHFTSNRRDGKTITEIQLPIAY